MATTPYTTEDPFEAGMNPSQPSEDRTFFGEVVVTDAWFCVLEKGVGKRLFDATRDDVNRRSTAIKIGVECKKRDGDTYTVDQDTLDWSKEWRDFTLPSLRQLGVDLRTLKGRWVQVKRQSTGETYTNKSGEVKNKTALVFMAVYPDEETMRQATETFYTPRSGDNTPAPAPAAPENFAEREFARQTLDALWNAVGQDEDKFLNALGNNPMLNKYFNADSPEVQNYTRPF